MPIKDRPRKLSAGKRFKMPLRFRYPTAAEAKLVRKLSPIKPHTKVGKVELNLLARNWIASWQAIQYFGYTRLADGIFKLRKKFRNMSFGMIIMDKQYGRDRYDNPSCWGRYRWVVLRGIPSVTSVKNFRAMLKRRMPATKKKTKK